MLLTSGNRDNIDQTKKITDEKKLLTSGNRDNIDQTRVYTWNTRA